MWLFLDETHTVNNSKAVLLKEYCFRLIIFTFQINVPSHFLKIKIKNKKS